MDIINRTVSFRIRDVSIPAAQQLVMELHGDDILHGKAIDLTDSGTEVYAVVEVAGLTQAVVIAVDRIVAVADGSNGFSEAPHPAREENAR